MPLAIDVLFDAVAICIHRETMCLVPHMLEPMHAA